MSKERKTFSLDPEVKAYLDAEGRNASETVNKLVKMEMGDEALNEEIIRMRMDMEKDRYEDAAAQARGHLKRYNELKSRLEKRESQEEKVLQEAAETLSRHQLHEDSNPVEFWAEKADMDIGTFLSEMEERIDE